jgi:hypothetical protein
MLQSDVIKVTKFIHNGDLKTKFFNDQRLFVENAELPTLELNTALLTPKVTVTTVLCNFQQFWDLRQSIHEKRGYIDVMDTNGNTISLFPKNIEYEWQNNLMEVIGEVKAFN